MHKLCGYTQTDLHFAHDTKSATEASASWGLRGTWLSADTITQHGVVPLGCILIQASQLELLPACVGSC